MEQRQHINAYGVNLTFNSDPSRALRLNLLLGYGRETMKTEENNYKVNLYRAPANTFDADLGILWNDRRWGAEFLVKAAYEDKRERKISSNVIFRRLRTVWTCTISARSENRTAME